MRLAASNLAWDMAVEPAALALLRQHGFTGIEVAPTRLWPDWQGATVAAGRMLAQRLGDEGFTVPALQAVLYGVPEVALFGGEVARQRFSDHLMGVADLAAALGAEVVVLGAPGVRKRGKLNLEAALESVLPVLFQLGRAYHDRGAMLCIEPNPPQYGCDFITTPDEGHELVSRVASPGFGLHLDVGGTVMAGLDPVAVVRDLAGRFRHLHASEPQLGPYPVEVVERHQAVGQALQATQYSGWVSLEMREQPDGLVSLEQALAAIAVSYGDPQ